MQDVAVITGGDFTMGPGTLYGTLKRMLDSGLVTEASRRDPESDAERRKYYRLTPAGREMFLPLGRIVGVGRADFVSIDLIFSDGSRRALHYMGGSGVAPGRLLPFIVPMMPGSVYSMRTPLSSWRLGSGSRRIDGELSKGAGLQARFAVPEAFESQHVNCYGLRMFWSGRAESGVARR